MKCILFKFALVLILCRCFPLAAQNISELEEFNNSHNYSAGIVYFQANDTLFIKNHYANYLYGEMCLKTGNWIEAKRGYETAIKLSNPTRNFHEQLYSNDNFVYWASNDGLGVVYYNLGEKQKSLNALETAHRRLSQVSITYANKSTHYFNLACAYAINSEFDKAVNILKELLQFNPSYISAIKKEKDFIAMNSYKPFKELLEHGTTLNTNRAAKQAQGGNKKIMVAEDKKKDLPGIQPLISEAEKTAAVKNYMQHVFAKDTNWLRNHALTVDSFMSFISSVPNMGEQDFWMVKSDHTQGLKDPLLHRYMNDKNVMIKNIKEMLSEVPVSKNAIIHVHGEQDGYISKTFQTFDYYPCEITCKNDTYTLDAPSMIRFAGDPKIYFIIPADFMVFTVLD